MCRLYNTCPINVAYPVTLTQLRYSSAKTLAILPEVFIQEYCHRMQLMAGEIFL
jgi:hypothetical protein